MDEARGEVEALERLGAELRQPSQEWIALVYGATLALLEGRLEHAEGLIERARTVGARALASSAEVTYRVQIYLLRREQGRVAEIEDLIREAEEGYPTYRIFRCILPRLVLELGGRDEAQERLAALAENDFAVLPFDEEWTVSMALLAETACGLGDRERAEAIHDRLAPYADRVSLSYPEISLGPVARYLGLTAAAVGRPDEAERHFEAAIDLSRAIGAPTWEALTRRDLEEMRRASGP
jgi:tetratricopeptide (TPR) repeat protein